MFSTMRSFLSSPILAIAACSLSIGSALDAQCNYSWPSAAFGSGLNDVANCATVDGNGDLIVGGRFTAAGGTGAAYIARWDGSIWHALGSGMDYDVVSLTTLANGDVVAGGPFTTAGGVTVNGVARWDGSVWSSLGSGLDPFAPFGPSANAIQELANGDIVVGGQFSGAGGVAANNIARFDGSSWHALGAGLAGPVRDMTLSGSDLVVVGSFTTSGANVVNRIARWNGSIWSGYSIGLSLFSASAVAVSKTTGAIYVGGVFASAGGLPVNNIARFAGGVWSALGSGTNGPVVSMQAMPNGDILVAGAFTVANGVVVDRIARLTGTSWTSAFTAGANDTVQDVVVAANGDVVLTGQFTFAGGGAHNYIASIVSSCAPQVTSLGAGCAGSGGLNVLSVTEAPAIGGAYRATGSGMPAVAFVADILGLTTTALPLSVALPQALPGCNLYVNPDVIEVQLPNAGQVTTTVSLPVNPALISFVLNHQYVPLEVDLSFNFTQVTSSNAVQVTVGTF